jgi:hypothetical protein
MYEIIRDVNVLSFVEVYIQFLIMRKLNQMLISYFVSICFKLVLDWFTTEP